MDTFKLNRHSENNIGQFSGELHLEEFERRLAVALRRILAEASRNKKVTTTKKDSDGSGN